MAAAYGATATRIGILVAIIFLVYSYLKSSPTQTNAKWKIAQADKGHLNMGTTADTRGSFDEFLSALGAFESGTTDPKKQYAVVNSLGFSGKYQFGEVLLKDLGYYEYFLEADGKARYYGQGASQNEWRGEWTSKHGIQSYQHFLDSAAAQEKAIRAAFRLNLKYMDAHFGEQSRKLEEFLGKPITLREENTHVERTATVTLSGVLASAHLVGAFGTARALVTGKCPHDEYGTSMFKYLSDFGGFAVALADLGDKDAGKTFSFAWDWGARKVVDNFDLKKDVIDLKGFWFDYSKFSIRGDGEGNTDIDITEANNQIIKIKGIRVSQLTASHFTGVEGKFERTSE
jgi:hypothetical protein